MLTVPQVKHTLGCVPARLAQQECVLRQFQMNYLYFANQLSHKARS